MITNGLQTWRTFCYGGANWWVFSSTPLHFVPWLSVYHIVMQRIQSLLTSYLGVTLVTLVFDRYDCEISIKQLERDRHKVQRRARYTSQDDALESGQNKVGRATECVHPFPSSIRAHCTCTRDRIRSASWRGVWPKPPRTVELWNEVSSIITSVCNQKLRLHCNFLHSLSHAVPLAPCHHEAAESDRRHHRGIWHGKSV